MLIAHRRRLRRPRSKRLRWGLAVWVDANGVRHCCVVKPAKAVKCQ